MIALHIKTPWLLHLRLATQKERAMVHLQAGNNRNAAYGYSPKSEETNVSYKTDVHRKLLSWETVPKLSFSNLAEFT